MNKPNTLLVRALQELADAELAYRDRFNAHTAARLPAVAPEWDRLRLAGDHAREIIELARVRVT